MSAPSQPHDSPPSRWRLPIAAAAILVIGGGIGAAVWFAETRPASESAEQASGVGRRADPMDNQADAPAEPITVSYQPPPSGGYVGDAACAECHSEIADSFRSHPMALSITPIDLDSEAATLGPDGTATIPGAQRVYEVETHDGRLWHHELMYDADGETIYDQAVPMDYVVGSGKRAKAYLHQRDDLLFMSPLNWYAPGDQWDFAPGHTAEDERRFDRRVNDDCLACHAGQVAPLGRNINRYAQPAFHQMAIGCENCHGPGERHVRLQESGDSVGDFADEIVNPATLDHPRRESVCYQCHLNAAARVLRYGRSEFDFRPGQRLDEIWTMFVSEQRVTEDGRTEAVNHVQQMRASRCFIESDGELGCISCHDPHRVPAVEERVEFYRDRCFNCHDNQSCELPLERREEEDNSCIACHMPARTAAKIAHVTQTDHHISRSPDLLATPPSEPGELAAPPAAGSGPATLAFFNGAEQRLEPWERDRAMGLAAWLHGSQTGSRPPMIIAGLLRPLAQRLPEDGAVLTVLGAVAAEYQFPEQASEYFEAARDIPAAEESALSNLLRLYYLDSQWQQALECADRLLEIDPQNARVYALQADVLAQLRQYDAAIAAAEKAVQFNPTLLPVQRWLAQAYQNSGRAEDAKNQQEIIRRLEQATPP